MKSNQADREGGGEGEEKGDEVQDLGFRRELHRNYSQHVTCNNMVARGQGWSNIHKMLVDVAPD